jgi:hypothetical protein
MSESSATDTTKKTLEAVRGCLLEFGEKDDQLGRLVHLTIRGLSFVERQPDLLRALWERDPEKAADLEEADGAARLAKSEAENDYPLLHAQAVISLWSFLEASVRMLFATLMMKDSRALLVPALRKVKVNLATYEGLEEIDKYLYVLDLLEEGMGTRRRPGASRFDDLFAAFEMDAATPPDVVRCLLELYHVRNVLVHRHGRVDRRLLEDCPWLALLEGSELLISHKAYHQYSSALNVYMFYLTNRVLAHFGEVPLAHKPGCAEEKGHFVHNGKHLLEGATRKGLRVASGEVDSKGQG